MELRIKYSRIYRIYNLNNRGEVKLKKIRIIVSAIVILVVLTGCGNKTNNSQKDNTNTITTESTKESTADNQGNANKDTKVSSSTNSNNNTNTTTTNKADKSTNSKADKSTTNNTSSQSTAKESSKDQKSYYGSWKVTKLIPTHGAHETIDESTVIGKVMKFSSNEAGFGNDSFQNPEYKTTSLSATDLRKEYRREPTELGLSDDITYVSVIIDGKENQSNSFFVKDNNTLIYHPEGVFFEIKRVAQ